jgi:hypothetical protein
MSKNQSKIIWYGRPGGLSLLAFFMPALACIKKSSNMPLHPWRGIRRLHGNQMNQIHASHFASYFTPPISFLIHGENKMINTPHNSE